MSRTASMVLGAFARRSPLLAAMEYSSCRLTCGCGAIRVGASANGRVPTLTSSNATFRIRMVNQRRAEIQHLRALPKDMREPESAPLGAYGQSNERKERVLDIPDTADRRDIEYALFR